MGQNDSSFALTFDSYDTDTQPMPMGDAPPSLLLFGAYDGAISFLGRLRGTASYGGRCRCGWWYFSE